MQILNGIVTATDGGWLYNETQNILSVDNRVILGKEDDGKEWSEISMEKKELLESQWESEAEGIPNTNISEETLMKAQAYDIITGGVE